MDKIIGYHEIKSILSCDHIGSKNQTKWSIKGQTWVFCGFVLNLENRKSYSDHMKLTLLCWVKIHTALMSCVQIFFNLCKKCVKIAWLRIKCLIRIYHVKVPFSLTFIVLMFTPYHQNKREVFSNFCRLFRTLIKEIFPPLKKSLTLMYVTEY